jgi:hypothetical protein
MVADVEQAGFQEVLRRFERWRTIAAVLGQKPYDEPDFENGRLYFRWDYAEQVSKWPDAREQGDWAAYIIEPAPDGLFYVIRSLWHERASQRTESVEVVFAQAQAAGKYVLAHVANSIRYERKLKSMSILWRERGLGSKIDIAAPSEGILEGILKRTPHANLEMLREYQKRYFMLDHPEIFAVTASASSPYMQVLTLSFDQLDAELLDGLPVESVPAL